MMIIFPYIFHTPDHLQDRPNNYKRKLYTLITNLTQTVAQLMECPILSTFGKKWHNALFWLSVMCWIISTYFRRFTLLANVRYKNVFCSESHLNCSWFPNFKPSFPNIGVDGHSTLQHSSGDLFSDGTRVLSWPFAWRYWGKPQKTSVKIVGVLANILVGHLPNIQARSIVTSAALLGCRLLFWNGLYYPAEEFMVPASNVWKHWVPQQWSTAPGYGERKN
jgi:hypothetical protein